MKYKYYMKINSFRPQELSQVNLYCFGEDPEVTRPVKLRELELESQLLITQGSFVSKRYLKCIVILY